MTDNPVTEAEVLYDDGRIGIVYDKKRDLHFLTLGRNSTSLGRGVLEELAQTPINSFKQKLCAVEPDIKYILEQEKLSYSDVGMAIAQARLNEVEDELREAYQTAHRNIQ